MESCHCVRCGCSAWEECRGLTCPTCQDDTREVSLDLQIIQSMGRNLKVRAEATVGRS